MTKDEALAFDLALEALEGYCEHGAILRPLEVRDAIKQARSAPVQEPTIEDNSQDWAGMDGATAWHLIHRHADGWADVEKMMGEWLGANTPPPAAPVQESVECQYGNGGYACCEGGPCKADEQNNAAPVREDWGPGPHECHSLTAAPVQEPVAWRYRGILHDFDPSDWAEGPVTPLYTTPPAAQRQWVGLTDEERKNIHAMWVETDELTDEQDVVDFVEKLLKEKNT